MKKEIKCICTFVTTLQTEFSQLFIEFPWTVDKYYVVRSTAAFNSMDCYYIWHTFISHRMKCKAKQKKKKKTNGALLMFYKFTK